MMLVLRIIGLVLTWGPIVLSAVKEVEVLLSGKDGSEKKLAAKNLVQTALNARGIELNSATESMISGLIDFVVSVLNAWDKWKS
jgi:hypothetical protein